MAKWKIFIKKAEFILDRVFKAWAKIRTMRGKS